MKKKSKPKHEKKKVCNIQVYFAHTHIISIFQIFC